ncbi:MAG: uracil phosphoribosyltransferase [Bacteroidia bacterium]
MLHILDAQPSILTQVLAELRDKDLQKDRARFRRNLQRAGMILAYEISRHVPYVKATIESPLGSLEMPILSVPPVIACILRAGVGFLEGMQQIFDYADVAFVAAYRTHLTNREISVQVEYMATPALQNRILILADPMIATGKSLVAAHQFLTKRGQPKKTFIAGLIGAVEGIEFVRSQIPGAEIFLGALDKELTTRGYIVPGLGDAGDLAFGELT